MCDEKFEINVWELERKENEEIIGRNTDSSIPNTPTHCARMYQV